MRIVNPTAVLGEEIAEKFLKEKGYRIIERNFRKKYAEIDIIAIHQNTLVFIEVKTRKTDTYGSPFEAVAPWKVKHLIDLAQFYIITHKNLPDDMRIDAVGITLSQSNEVKHIEHLENVTGF